MKPLHDKPPAGGPRLAVFFSRFPVWNQTFALADLVALDRAGFQIEVFTLLGASGSIQQPEVQKFHGRVYRASHFAWSVWRENLKACCRPLTWYLLWQLIAGTFAHPKEFVKTCFLLPQAIYFAHRLQHHGVQHIHAAWASYPATAAWIASELTGIPFSFSGHAYDIYMVRSLLGVKIQRAQFVVTCAETNREELVRVGGADMRAKIHVHRHGVDLKRFYPVSRPNPEPIWQLMACGFLSPYKGFEHLVSACELMQRQGHQFRCTIIGEGPERERLTRQIHQAGLASMVQLSPPVPQPQLAELYHKANVFIHPSVVTKHGNRDVIPNVLVEAMASGVPIISTCLAGIRELIQDGVNGILVCPGDPHALADAIIALMQDRHRPEQLVEAAKQSVNEQYDRDKNAEGLIQTFRNAISPPSKS